MFKPYVNRLPSKNTFQVITTPTGNKGVFTGLPQYKIVKDQTVIDGYHGETPIMTMPIRPTAIIQYREDGVLIKTGENPNDSMGKFPPSYFNRL